MFYILPMPVKINACRHGQGALLAIQKNAPRPRVGAQLSQLNFLDLQPFHSGSDVFRNLVARRRHNYQCGQACNDGSIATPDLKEAVFYITTVALRHPTAASFADAARQPDGSVSRLTNDLIAVMGTPNRKTKPARKQFC